SRLSDDKDLFTGLFGTGTRARELGLIDEIGLMAPVIRRRYGDKAELRLVQPKKGLFGRPQPGIAIGSGQGALHSAGIGIAESLPGAVMESAAERALWARYGL
ncbi:MAG: S49 family peptidase, partial [Pseudomonadota bacterium]|nr:S49 family peptidase [Pseudomonadota bacterium]